MPYYNVIVRTFDKADETDMPLVVWFAAQFCKASDHKVRKESRIDKLLTYNLVGTLLQFMSLQVDARAGNVALLR